MRAVRDEGTSRDAVESSRARSLNFSRGGRSDVIFRSIEKNTRTDEGVGREGKGREGKGREGKEREGKGRAAIGPFPRAQVRLPGGPTRLERLENVYYTRTGGNGPSSERRVGPIS